MCYNYKNLQYVKIYSMKIAIMKYLNIHIKIQIKKTVKKVMYIWEQTRLLLLIIFKNKELIIDFYHVLKFRELKKKKRNGELKR